jgi:hypothetical protein
MHYTTAENYYNGDSAYGYSMCIQELNKAEENLGATNAKIMELKTRAWVKLVFQSKSITYLYVVDTCMKKFFKLADAKTYPQDRYFEMVSLQNEVQNYKDDVAKEFGKIYQQDYTLYGDMYALFDLYKDKMKIGTDVPFVSSSEKIPANRLIADTLYSLFEKNNQHYYAIPFKTGIKGGYLFWFYSGDKLGSWYMAFRNKDQQRDAIMEDKTGFFESFNMSNAINLFGKLRKRDEWPHVIIQKSAIKLEPNTDYYIWFSSNSDYTLKETKSVPIFYSLYITDDAEKTWNNFFSNKENQKLIRQRGYYNNEY